MIVKKFDCLYKRNITTNRIMGVELILGMEEVINYLKELEAENKKLKEPMVGELEDYLEMNGAEGGIIKTQHERDFYKKKVVELQAELDNEESAEGLDLVQIKFLTEQNKKLTEEMDKIKKGLDVMKEEMAAEYLTLQETSFQKGFDAGREEYEVDKECLDEKDKQIEELKEKLNSP